MVFLLINVRIEPKRVRIFKLFPSAGFNMNRPQVWSYVAII